MSHLLSFHKSILREICDPQSSELIILARGLGLRRIITTLLGIMDDPRNLIVLVSPGEEEESDIAEEMRLNLIRNKEIGKKELAEGKGLKVLGYETPSKERKEIYKLGGVVCVTSRILVVDMLQGDLEVGLVTGLIILHAERITPLVIEAFIVRLFREKNKKGFVKAFSDQPEQIGRGRVGGELNPLKMVMKELSLRKVFIYPRFHETINKSLERRKADVVELSQPLTKNMEDIHYAIIQCMTITLSELKKSNTNLDLDDLNIENAYFRSFDSIVRHQLSSVWHKVGPRTKQLVNDLKVLRQLLFYLLSYDAVAFNAYLETIIASNDISITTGTQKQHQSPWLLTESAEVMIRASRRRCFIITSTSTFTSSTQQQQQQQHQIQQEEEEEEGWAVLDELEGVQMKKSNNDKGKGREEEENEKPKWLPYNIQPTLEELPKWNLLSEILEEIEYETVHLQSQTSNNKNKKPTHVKESCKVLIMTSSTRSCELIQEYLNCRSGSGAGGQGGGEGGRNGRKMMMKKLKEYLGWRGRLRVSQNQTQNRSKSKSYANANTSSITRINSGSGSGSGIRGGNGGQGGQGDVSVSEALKKKDREKVERAGARRRVRGGGPAGSGSRHGSGNSKGGDMDSTTIVDDVDMEGIDSMQLWTTQSTSDILTDFTTETELQMQTFESQYENYYGLIRDEELVVIRAYSDDSDDRMLDELKPRFIVMFEPCVEFVRRVEVYKGSNPGFSVRVYHMVYANSSEEHRYLASIRKEKEAFEKLVHERQTMVITLEDRHEPGNTNVGDSMIKTISTRLAGGRRELSKEPSRVVVDMREFRSTLPSLIHAASMLVVPATIIVGDYILTPEICVERKSLPDLVSSFNSGRLYTQCEMMSTYYKHPVLLIEFEEDKAFSMDIISDMKSHVKCPPKSSSSRTSSIVQAQAYGAQTYKDTSSSSSSSPYQISIQQKLVLLTLHFPQLRIIWSSSPYFTAEVFKELKLNQGEPDPIHAMKIGYSDFESVDGNGGVGVGVGVNNAAEEVLRCIPGIGVSVTGTGTGRGGGGGANVSKVMNQVGSIKELCKMKMDEVELLLGKEDGSKCWEFLHFGERGVGGK